MTTGVAAGSLVSVETAGASGAASTGSEIGAREASIELSATRLVERVPQPPTATPRTANTTRIGPTREIERTPSPLFLGSVTDFGRWGLFAHGRETSVKSRVTPALFVKRPERLAVPSSTGPAEARRLQP